MEQLPNRLPYETWPERRIREALDASTYKITEEMRSSIGEVANAARDNVAATEIIADVIDSASYAVQSSIHSLNERFVETTDVIENSIQRLGDDVVAAVQAGASEISLELGKIGSLIAVTSAIAIAQREITNTLLSEISHAIRNPRATAAQEYIRRAQKLRSAGSDTFRLKIDQCLEQAVKKDPTSFLARFFFAEFLFELSDFSKGDNLLSSAILLANNNTEKRAALYLQAINLRGRGDYPNALEAAAKLAQVDSSSQVKYLNGQLHILCGETQAGLRLVANAIGMNNKLYAVAAIDPMLRNCKKDALVMLGTLSSEIQLTIHERMNSLHSLDKLRRAAERCIGYKVRLDELESSGRTDMASLDYEELCKLPTKIEQAVEASWRKIEADCDSALRRAIAECERIELSLKDKMNGFDEQKKRTQIEIAEWRQEMQQRTPRWIRHLFGVKPEQFDDPTQLVNRIERAQENYWNAWRLNEAAHNRRMKFFILRHNIHAKFKERTISPSDFGFDLIDCN